MGTKRQLASLDFNQTSALIQAFFERLAADPASPVEAQEWFNETEDVRKTVANGTIETYAFRSWVLEQINALGRLQGNFDANPGNLPTVADKTTGDLSNLQAGDAWIISNGGTLANILGDDNLSIGDKIQYVGGDGTDPANWVGIQTNLDDAIIGMATPERQVVALVANTPLTVTAANISDIHTTQVFDNTNQEIGVCISRGTNPNQVILESTASLTGVIVQMVGATN